MPLKNQTIQDPGFTDVLVRMKAGIFASLNGAQVGKIVSFNPTKKTAEIQLLIKRVLPDGSVASYPPLLDCPIVTLQGSTGFLKIPIVAGDQCLVIFCDRDIDSWFKTGNESAPFSPRCHDLSDGFAIVGINSSASSLAAYKTNEAEFGYAGAVVGLKGGKVKIEGVATDLLAVLVQFIDVLKTLETVPGGGPLNSTSIAALEAFKLIFQGFLYS